MFYALSFLSHFDLLILLLVIYIRKSQQNKIITYTKMFVTLLTVMTVEIIQTSNTQGMAQQTMLTCQNTTI